MKRALLAVFLIAVHGALFAQATQPKAPPVGLKGYDPVSYFTPGKATQGTSSINFDFDDTRYLFANQKNREAFATNPDRYTPQFSGLCATGLAMGMKTEADPKIFKVIDGKLYVFSNAAALAKMEKEPLLLKKAHRAWEKPAR